MDIQKKEKILKQVVRIDNAFKVDIYGRRKRHVSFFVFYFTFLITLFVLLYVFDFLSLYWTLTIAIVVFAFHGLFLKWSPALLATFYTFKAPLCHATYACIVTEHGDVELVQVKTYEKEGAKMKFIVYRCCRLCFDSKLGIFVQNSTSPQVALQEELSVEQGLNKAIVAERLLKFGENIIKVNHKSFPFLFLDEVTRPFIIFQLCACFVWATQGQTPYSAVIFVLMWFNIITSLLRQLATCKRLDEISKHICDVFVFREGEWSMISCLDLVPGDIVEIDNSSAVLACDILLLNGEVIVDESMLTGESVPVVKNQLKDISINDLDPYDLPKKHILFCGTRVIQSRQNGKVCSGIVLNTGFNSSKGLLVRAIMFPKPNNFAFYKDAVKFIAFLSIFAILGFIVSTIYLYKKFNIAVGDIIGRGLDLVTIIVPPALPATMSVGISYAIKKLVREKIFCISPTSIIIGGKIDIICFDKTGTLTEDGLDLHGFLPSVNDTGSKFKELLSDPGEADLGVVECMASCHSVKVVEERLLGDPLEVIMFESSRWRIQENHPEHILSQVVSPKSKVQYTLDTVRVFDFCAKLRLMTAIVQPSTSESLVAYCKGAPENVKQACSPESIPKDFDKVLSDYAHQGYRVLALAVKNLNTTNHSSLIRSNVENEMTFLGFLSFENKLKPETKPVINQLNSAQFRNTMVTGDNLMTAISVSRACNLVEPSSLVFYPKFDGDEVIWCEANDSDTTCIDPETLFPQDFLSVPYYFACTGDSLN